MKFAIVAVVILAAIALWVFMKSPKPKPTPNPVPMPEQASAPANPTLPESPAQWAIKGQPEDIPKFRRFYSVNLKSRPSVKLTIQARSYLGDRMITGELTQSNGRWVTFEPDNPAEKILDPIILPEVRQLCKQMIAADSKFVASRPNKFTNERGESWVRVD